MKNFFYPAREDLIFLKHLYNIYIIITFISLFAVSCVFHPKIFNTNLTLTGATFIIPLAFLIQNIITEVYGFPESRKLTHRNIRLLVFVLIFIALLNLYLLQQLGDYTYFIRYLKSTSRHILSFIFASFIGLLLNDYVISRLKIYFFGKHLGFRFLLSSAIGEAAFMSCGFIAWYGYLNEIYQVLPLIIVSFFYRLLFIWSTLPIASWLSKKLKIKEGVDAYDFNISYNPFKFK